MTRTAKGAIDLGPAKDQSPAISTGEWTQQEDKNGNRAQRRLYARHHGGFKKGKYRDSH